MVQSNTITITVEPQVVVNPKITVAPASITSFPTTVTVTGTGFTPNSQAELGYFIGSSQVAGGFQSVDSSGNVAASTNFTANPDLSGALSYTLGVSIVDGPTGQVSNTVNVSVGIAGVATGITLQATNPTTMVNTADGVSGTVTDQNGNPLSGATVTLTDSTTGSTMTATTNQSGIYSFQVTFTSAGTYQLYASA